MNTELFSRRFVRLLLIGFTVLVLSYIWVDHFSRVQKEDQFLTTRMKLVSDSLIDKVRLIDKLYIAIEMYGEKDALTGLTSLKAHYENFGRLPDDLSSFIKNSPSIDLYVIDTANQIVATTNPTDLGLDFSKDKAFIAYLDKVRAGQKYFNPRFSQSVRTGKIFKYSYLASSDKRYIFEAGNDLSEFNQLLGNDSLSHFSSQLALSEPGVQSIEAYQADGTCWSLDSSKSMTAPQDANRLKGLKVAIESRKTVTISQRKPGYTTTYIYAPYFMFNHYGSETPFVIETTYNDLHVIQANKHSLFTVLLTSLMLIVALYLLDSYFRHTFIRPLSAVLDGIQRVRTNDFTTPVKISTNNEIQLLANHFNDMVVHVISLLQEKNAAQEMLQNLLDQNEEGFFETVMALANSIDAKDSYTGGHCERVMEYSLKLGTRLHLPDSQMRVLKYGAILHDIGKIGIADDVLNKPGYFNHEEYFEMKKHPEIGCRIIQQIDFLKDARDIVLSHHERVDGSGYPHGLKGDQISTLAKIVSIADAFDAMTSERPYRERSLTIDEAFQELRDKSGTQFDKSLTLLFIESFSTSPRLTGGDS